MSCLANMHAPDALLEIAEAQMANVPMEPQSPDSVRLSLLSQIVSEISLSMQFDLCEVQRNRLVHSSNGLLQWIGLNAVERQLEKPGGLAGVLQLIVALSHTEQVPDGVCTYYLRECGMTHCKLESLSRDARELAMVRPMVEWCSEAAGKQGELAGFLDQVEALLASSNK